MPIVTGPMFTATNVSFGQDFFKKYHSQVGFQLELQMVFSNYAYNDLMDMDGDGKPEIVLERVNELGARIEFVVINHEEQVLWQLNADDLAALGIVDVYLPFIGFFQ